MCMYHHHSSLARVIGVHEQILQLPPSTIGSFNCGGRQWTATVYVVQPHLSRRSSPSLPFYCALLLFQEEWLIASISLFFAELTIGSLSYTDLYIMLPAWLLVSGMLLVVCHTYKFVLCSLYLQDVYELMHLQLMYSFFFMVLCVMIEIYTSIPRCDTAAAHNQAEQPDFNFTYD